MASLQNSTMGGVSSPTPLSTLPVLETVFPGFSIISGLFSKYLQLDIGAYVSFVLLLATVVATVRLRLENVAETLQSYFTSTMEVRMDDDVFNYLMYWVSRQRFSRNSTRTVASTKIDAHSYFFDEESDYDDDNDDRDDDADDEDANDANENEKKSADASNDFDTYWAQRVKKDKIKPLRITPAEGNHWFKFRNRNIKFSRQSIDKGSFGWGRTREKLFVTCYGRDSDILRQLLLEAQRMYVDRDGDKTIIYRAQRDAGDYDWTRCMARPPRPLSTVVLDNAQKQAFITDIKEYLHPKTRRWYSNRGIPYRRGYMFHGPPGTGKSSLCFAVAGAMHLKIYLISLNSKTMTEDALANLFQSLPRRCIVLLEDVDAAGVANLRAEKSEDRSKSEDHGTENPGNDDLDKDTPVIVRGPKDDGNTDNTPPKQGISLSALLNIIDGVASSEGRILVMTTNHIEKLDPALLRPGRVDLSIAFGYSDRETIKNLFMAIYAPLDCEKPKSSSSSSSLFSKFSEKHSRAEIGELAEKFADSIPEGEFSPAEIQGHLLLYKNHPTQAIEEAKTWVQETRQRRRDRKEL